LLNFFFTIKILSREFVRNCNKSCSILSIFHPIIHLKKIVRVSIFFFLSYEVCDDIVRIFGRDEVMAGELVEFKEGTIGTTLNLESKKCWCCINGR
jgi:hypothetical protein